MVTQFWCFIDRDKLAVHWCLAVPCSALHSLCFVNFMLCRCNTARGFPNRCPSGWLRKGSWFLEAWTAECHAMAIMATYGHRCQAGWSRKSTTAGSGGSQWTGGVEGVLYCRTEMKVVVKLVGMCRMYMASVAGWDLCL